MSKLVDIENLRALAEAANDDMGWMSAPYLARFHEAAAPQAILYLLNTIDALQAENERLREVLGAVLPMAKGYAAQNKVGRNADTISSAERTLAQISQHTHRAGQGDNIDECALCGRDIRNAIHIRAALEGKDGCS